MEKATLTIPEAAKVLGISVRLAYVQAKKLTLPGVRKIGGRYVVSMRELELYLGPPRQDEGPGNGHSNGSKVSLYHYL